ncbi:transposon TX1, partial [Tanacetum coccineum]
VGLFSRSLIGEGMNNVNHEIKRWLHKLRRWNSSYSPSGRMTWLNIIGVLISCWAESIFKRIMRLHGIIAETQNYRLEGNQNLKYGKVLIHTTATDLINKSLSINYKGKSFKIKVIEEVMDISFVDIEENNEVNQAKNEPEKGEDSKGMDISDGDGGESGEDSNSDDDSLDRGNWASIGTKVSDSFEDDDGYSKKKITAKKNETPKEPVDKKENSKWCDYKNEAVCSKNKEVNVQHRSINQHQSKRDQIQATSIDKEDLIIDDTIIRAEKIEGSPSIAFGSGGEKSRKKRKANIESVLEEYNITNKFDQGLRNDEKNNGRKKIGSRSYKKTMKVARQMGTTGLGDGTKGMSDACKESHKVVEENERVFVFKGSERAESDNRSCSISVERVNEISKEIGVSWALAEEDGPNIGANIANNEAGNGTVGIEQVVENAWKKSTRSRHPDCILRDKLKNVKDDIRKWSKERFGTTREKIKGHKKEAIRWELEVENSPLNESEKAIWLEARGYWLKRKRSWRNNKNNIRGLMVNGVWHEDPNLIKKEVTRHYKVLFSERTAIRPIFCSNKVKKISTKEARLLEQEVTKKEIWDTICGYGRDKAPVNGSPSDEFCLKREVRQGDPLSPFLLILETKGLNVMVSGGRDSRMKEAHYGLRDRWRCTLQDDGGFTVKALSKIVEEKILRVENGAQETLWNKWVPKKVSIFIWRALEGRLPVRKELDKNKEYLR